MDKRGCCINGYKFRFLQKLQPVFCFIALFQSNLQFRNEIRSAVRIVRFSDICANACRRSFQLINEGIVSFDCFAQLQNLDRKTHRHVRELTVCQCDHPKTILLFSELGSNSEIVADAAVKSKAGTFGEIECVHPVK